MPLGNLTSQFFANVYLNELDQFVKHTLKAEYYIRYVDDFVVLSHSKSRLPEYKEKINTFLKEKLSLRLHPDKSHVSPLQYGIGFLGFRIFYHHKLLRKSNLKNFERKFRELKIFYAEKQIRREKVIECLEGWMAYAKHANTYKYRRALLRMFNREFPIYHKNQIIRSKKIKNFYRKVYASKVEFSTQKTLLLVKKGHSIQEIATIRSIKEETVWAHFANLIEHGQLPVWKIMSRKKIVTILQHIKSSRESLREIKKSVASATFNEIECVRAHLKMKTKIKHKKQPN
jgi:hypothetical protein